MAKFQTDRYKISAIYSCVPKNKLRTEDYEWISVEERKMFAKTTGIIERRVATEGITCSDLCFNAADELLNEFQIRDKIDLVLFVSQSPDYFLPATSIVLQNRLGITKSAMAFDVNLGCSGYVYGLSIASNFLKNEGIRNVLLLAGDKSTISTSYKDKSTYPLFGDAGTATLIQKTDDVENNGNWYFNMYSDGSGADAIRIEEGHSRYPYQPEKKEVYELIDKGIERTKMHLALDGMKVFNFALKEVTPSIRELLDFSRKELSDVDYFLLHQANLLINESIRKKLKLEASKFPISIDEFGNTSSASIPLTICSRMSEIEWSKPKTILMSGFGVGLSWANLLLEITRPALKLLEHD